jgi:polysaccharide biosynthesis/export protein
MRKKIISTATAATAALAMLLAGAGLLPAQDADSPAPQQSDAGSKSSDAATQQILKAVQGQGKTIKFDILPLAGDHYKVRGGDYVNVNFTIDTQFSESVPVRPDGYIALIGAPEIYVMGKTTSQIADEVRQAYQGILGGEPLLSVAVRNFENPFFVVGGEVNRPGKYFLHGDTTMAQCIAIAGGFKSVTAKDSEALLLRRVSDDYVQAKVIDLKYIDKGELWNDMHLQSGDMIFIPKNRLSKVQPFISYFLVYSVLNINLIGGNIGVVGH